MAKKREKTTWYGCIYLFENLINFKHYVGQTVFDFRVRAMGHVGAARGRPKYPLHAALRKYDADDSFMIRVLSRHHTRKTLNAAEKRWIKAWGSRADQWGYNLTDGGEGVVGYTFDESARQRTARGVRGYWQSLSPEMREMVVQTRAEKRREVDAARTLTERLAIKEKRLITWARSSKREDCSKAHSECARRQWAVLTEEERAARGRVHSEHLRITLGAMSAAERKAKFGRPRSSLTRRRISESMKKAHAENPALAEAVRRAQKGRVWPADIVERRAASCRGKKRSAKFCREVSIRFKGKRFSVEHKARLKVASTKRWARVEDHEQARVSAIRRYKRERVCQ